MKYVKRYIDRQGSTRLYFRKKGHPRDGEALISPWPDVAEGSALQVEIERILRPERAGGLAPNLKAATRAYELSADFQNLAPSTQYEYRLLLKEFDADLGDVAPLQFTPAFLLELRDAWAARGHRAANMRLQLLKNVLTPAFIAADLADPFARINQVRRPHSAPEPHPLWPEWVVLEAIQAAIDENQFGLARGIALGRWAGPRRGDIVKIPEHARHAGRLRFLSGKRRVLVDMPEDPLLTHWLAATPASQPLSKWQRHVQRKNGVHRLPPGRLVYNTRNLPFTEDGFGQALADLLGRLHEEGRIDADHYSAHGLRHTFGVELAEAGATDAQGAALMGHSSPHSFATYRRQANRLKLSNEGAALLRALRERRAGEGKRTVPEQEVSSECLEVSNQANPSPRRQG